jgi:hypothetical protein
MAKLRDARTSEIVFEGTPLECVLAAQELGGAEIAPQLAEGTEEHDLKAELIYDDVGLHFDPEAVLKQANDTAAGLDAAASDAKGADLKRVTAAADEAKAALEVDASAVRDASAAVEAARAAQDEALSA